MLSRRSANDQGTGTCDGGATIASMQELQVAIRMLRWVRQPVVFSASLQIHVPLGWRFLRLGQSNMGRWTVHIVAGHHISFVDEKRGVDGLMKP